MEHNIEDVDLFICVSFVPFLSVSNSNFISPEMLKSIVESPNPLAFGCMYDEISDTFSVIINRAEELRNEMLNWSGGDDSYFQLHFIGNDEISDLIITPNNELSKKRFITSMKANHGLEIGKENVFCVSKFIQCCWKSDANKLVFDILNKKIENKEKLKTSFVEYKDIISGKKDVVVYMLGSFDISNDQPNLMQNPFIEREVN